MTSSISKIRHVKFTAKIVAASTGQQRQQSKATHRRQQQAEPARHIRSHHHKKRSRHCARVRSARGLCERRRGSSSRSNQDSVKSRERLPWGDGLKYANKLSSVVCFFLRFFSTYLLHTSTYLALTTSAHHSARTLIS